MGSYNYTISIGHLGEQLTLNQWVLGSSPRWCTIPSKSERTSFRRCVRICFLSSVYVYEIERALRKENSSPQGFWFINYNS